MKKLITTIFIIVIFVTGMQFCCALDNNPPPWRNNPNTTYARWEFSTPYSSQPDQWNNPVGPPEIDIATNESWEYFVYERYGIWPMFSGRIEVDIGNYQRGQNKEIWIQITWKPAPSSPVVSALRLDPYVDEQVFGQEMQRVPIEPGGWYHSTYSITLPTNPQIERIIIQGGYWLDELVIDTICIPELSLAILLAGLLTLKKED